MYYDYMKCEGCKYITRKINIVLMYQCFLFEGGWSKKYLCDDCCKRLSK